MRMLANQNDTLLNALAKTATGNRTDPQTLDDQLAEILRTPARYPTPWVLEAENRRSINNREHQLEQLALYKDWLPKIPRL